MTQEIVKIHEGEIVTIFDQINALIENALSIETRLDNSYAKIGMLLTEVSEQELWRQTEFPSFSKYLDNLTEKYHKGRTSLYTYFSAVREMKPYLSEDQMNQMGISKLNVLKRTTRELGFPPATAVIETALDPNTTVSEVRRSVAQNHKLAEEEQAGTWFDLGGFFVTPEERLVLREGFEAAWRCDPVVQKTVKESIRLKEGLLRLAMEFLASHSSAVEEGVA